MQKTILFAIFMMAASVLLSGCTGQPAGYRNTAAVTGDNAQAGGNAQAGASTGQAGIAAANTTASNGSACQQNSVYFVHADWCPHCQKMAPWVADLETQGYRFVSVTSDNLASMKDCLAGIAQMQYIPEFVCISNKQDHVGEFADENELKAFADACGAGPQ